MRNLTVNGERLWASLMELAQIGATAKGGVCRLAASDLDAEARSLFIRWCEEAGCTVTVDRIGNIFARRPGRNLDLPPVMAGSHLDTQPTGGRFDGAYGVMAGLEVVRPLVGHRRADDGVVPGHVQGKALDRGERRNHLRPRPVRPRGWRSPARAPAARPG